MFGRFVESDFLDPDEIVDAGDDFLIAPEGMGGVRGGWREGISPWCK